jgi:hypothetical protein
MAAEHMNAEPDPKLNPDQEREIAEIVKEAGAEYGVEDPAPWSED